MVTLSQSYFHAVWFSCFTSHNRDCHVAARDMITHFRQCLAGCDFAYNKGRRFVESHLVRRLVMTIRIKLGSARPLSIAVFFVASKGAETYNFTTYSILYYCYGERRDETSGFNSVYTLWLIIRRSGFDRRYLYMGVIGVYNLRWSKRLKL